MILPAIDPLVSIRALLIVESLLTVVLPIWPLLLISGLTGLTVIALAIFLLAIYSLLAVGALAVFLSILPRLISISLIQALLPVHARLAQLGLSAIILAVWALLAVKPLLPGWAVLILTPIRGGLHPISLSILALGISGIGLLGAAAFALYRNHQNDSANHCAESKCISIVFHDGVLSFLRFYRFQSILSLYVPGPHIWTGGFFPAHCAKSKFSGRHDNTSNPVDPIARLLISVNGSEGETPFFRFANRLIRLALRAISCHRVSNDRYASRRPGKKKIPTALLPNTLPTVFIP